MRRKNPHSSCCIVESSHCWTVTGPVLHFPTARSERYYVQYQCLLFHFIVTRDHEFARKDLPACVAGLQASLSLWESVGETENRGIHAEVGLGPVAWNDTSDALPTSCTTMASCKHDYHANDVRYGMHDDLIKALRGQGAGTNIRADILAL